MSNRKQTHLCVINQSCGDWKSRWQDRVLLTGCWGASLSILKTCATFPLARRCILKPGMAHLVARLIILEQWEREGEKGRITQMLVQIFIRCVLKTKINETDCGSDYFQICIIICKSHLQHVLFCISNLFTLFFLWLSKENHPRGVWISYSFCLMKYCSHRCLPWVDSIFIAEWLHALSDYRKTHFISAYYHQRW